MNLPGKSGQKDGGKMGFLNPPKSIGEIEEEDERTKARLSLEEKRALLRELKKRHGRDWKLHLPKVESGFDWNALKFKLH